MTVLAYFILDGVAIFFVLSGYLIGGILIRTLEDKEAGFTVLFSFWKRRWLRTLPAYYFVLILLIVLPAAYTFYTGGSEVARYFFFLQNVYMPQPKFFSEAWSLSVEEWFYLLIPAIIFSLHKIARQPAKRSVLMTVVIVIAVSVGYRYFIFTSGTINGIEQWDMLLRKQVMTQLDSIVTGVMGAYVFHYHIAVWSRYKRILLAIGIVILICMKLVMEIRPGGMGLFISVFYLSVNSMGVLCLLPYLSELKTGKGIIYRSVTYISIISYSMYLLNLSFVQGFVLRKIDFHNVVFLSSAARYCCFWILTILGAVILYKSVERPFMQLREKK